MSYLLGPRLQLVYSATAEPFLLDRPPLPLFLSEPRAMLHR